MKCPLLLAGENAQPSVDMTTTIDCLKEECAWWDKVHGVCVVISLFWELRLLVGAGAMIADKMPPAKL